MERGFLFRVIRMLPGPFQDTTQWGKLTSSSRMCVYMYLLTSVKLVSWSFSQSVSQSVSQLVSQSVSQLVSQCQWYPDSALLGQC